MQLTSIAPPVTLPPIGATSFGTMRIGHALNGIAYTEHELTAALVPPAATFGGSLANAIEAASLLAKQYDSAGAHATIALTTLKGAFAAHVLSVDPTVAYAVGNGAGSGGIASISFPTISKSLAALVTSEGSLIPAEMR